MPPVDPLRPVLILGAGVNGACVARELALNGVPVWIADSGDIAAGATSKSSRLIHGGLRYLEYGEFHLVRESIQERDRLRKLAPQFVEPLRLYIPVSRRFSGLATSALRFLGLSRVKMFRKLAKKLRNERGLWLVRFGLWLYDRFASNADFPKHTVVHAGDAGAPAVYSARKRWLCSYSDGQMRYPERFNVALLTDAARAADDRGVEFRVLTHHRARADGSAVVLTPDNASRRVGLSPRDETNDRSRYAASGGVEALRITPSLIVNATGAWGDFTLRELGVPAPPLFGGTKGSHFLTRKSSLVEALRGHGVYAEAADGRLVFVLPFGDAVLVGTTDERFEGHPGEAIATEAEIDYLLGMAGALFPQVPLTRSDVESHCCGVRPLPRAGGGATAAISRDHAIVEHRLGETPVLTLVGGKLTTCRAFGEEVAGRVLKTLGVERTADTRDRVVPGGENYPADAAAVDHRIEDIARNEGLTTRQARAVWSLFGTRTAEILRTPGVSRLAGLRIPHQMLDDTDIPIKAVKWIIDHEWPTTLEDLVERRLMLVWQQGWTHRTLRRLLGLLFDAGRLPIESGDRAIDACVERLRLHYGRTIEAHVSAGVNHESAMRVEG